MTSLQWTLLAIAAVLLVALYAHGKWQEHKSARLIDDSDVPPLERQASRVPSTRSARQPSIRIEPTMGIAPELEAADSANEQTSAEVAPVGGWVEDAMLDVMFELRCTHAFDGVAALEARAQLDRLALPLPTHLAVWDSKVSLWSLPDRFGFYSEMLIAVQLASRRHALSEIDASRFVSAVQQIALAIDADFDPPNVARLVHQAAELDRLCARFDVQITLTLESLAGPWSSDALNAAATEAGLTQVTPSRWEQLSAADAPAALSMTAAASPTPQVALMLDVPRAIANPPPVSTLFTVAHQLAARLNARVVDDNGRGVEPAAQSTIEAELDTLTGDMRAAGIEPGSPRAHRLYTD